ncbi:hypothetical protein [Spiroplasma poulsonii]|uniref:hypothetical protein n=1 Tax=Spiroplasma poulsonii TaxID=2138 RepID=UPI001F4CAB25|nr:hypothetical protein [Spiroplasma poulsonii]UNF61644.1 hypothetical protein MNU24_06955 [Spiroplasma poulsonii]
MGKTNKLSLENRLLMTLFNDENIRLLIFIFGKSLILVRLSIIWPCSGWSVFRTKNTVFSWQKLTVDVCVMKLATWCYQTPIQRQKKEWYTLFWGF